MSDLIERLSDVLRDDVLREVRELVNFRADVEAALPFGVGDVVSLREPVSVTKESGWYAWRNMLVPGNPATIRELYWSTKEKAWGVLLSFAVEWSESQWPDGLHVYARTDDSRPRCFYFWLDDVREPAATDHAPEIPAGVA